MRNEAHQLGFQSDFSHFPPESTDSNWRARILKAFIPETVFPLLP